MILLDTNVLSEAMRPQPNPTVLAWLDEQVAETLYISSIVVAELMFGIGAMPDGRRKAALHQAFKGLLSLFEGRVLAFDLDAAQAYAELAVTARASGKGLSTADGYIAATAKARGMAIATRDLAPFQAAGLTTINPWAVL